MNSTSIFGSIAKDDIGLDLDLLVIIDDEQEIKKWGE
jgi:predicted nucleotidyltransferase